MKRLLTFLTIMSVVALCGACDEKKSSKEKETAKEPKRFNWDNDKYPLNGDISSVTINYTYYYDDLGEFPAYEPYRHTEKYEFNEKGWVTTKLIDRGDSQELYEYDYDESKRSVSERVTSKGYSRQHYTEERLYIYNESWNIIEERHYAKNYDINCKVIYKYDAKGRLIEKAAYDGDDNPTYLPIKGDWEGEMPTIHKETFKYNSNNQLIEISEQWVSYDYEIDKYSVLGNTNTYEPNPEYNKNREEEYESKNKYTYISNKKIIDRPGERFIYEYDDQKNIISIERYFDSSWDNSKTPTELDYSIKFDIQYRE